MKTSCRSIQKATAVIGRLRRRRSGRHGGGTWWSIDAGWSPTSEGTLAGTYNFRSEIVLAADGLQICGYRQGTEQSAARANMLGLGTTIRVIFMMGGVNRISNWRNERRILRAVMIDDGVVHIGVIDGRVMHGRVMHGRVIMRGILLRNMRNTMMLVTVVFAPLLAALMWPNLATIGNG